MKFTNIFLLLFLRCLETHTQVVLQIPSDIIVSKELEQMQNGAGNVFSIVRYTEKVSEIFYSNDKYVLPEFTNHVQYFAIGTEEKTIVAVNDLMNSNMQLAITLYNRDETPAALCNKTTEIDLPFTAESADAYGLITQMDGKIVICVYFIDEQNLTIKYILIRFNEQGEVDTSFGDDGLMINNYGFSEASFLQSDVGLYATGYTHLEAVDYFTTLEYKKTKSADFKIPDIINVSSENLRSEQNALFLYPNPASDKVNISIAAGEASSLQITDVYGKLLFSEIIPAGFFESQIRISQFRDGLYIVTLQNCCKRMTQYFLKQ